MVIVHMKGNERQFNMKILFTITRDQLVKIPYEILLTFPEWYAFRDAYILRLPNLICMKCENCEGNEIHHKKYRKKDKILPWEYRDDELEWLCDDCHESKHPKKKNRKKKDQEFEIENNELRQIKSQLEDEISDLRAFIYKYEIFFSRNGHHNLQDKRMLLPERLWKFFKQQEKTKDELFWEFYDAVSKLPRETGSWRDYLDPDSSDFQLLFYKYVTKDITSWAFWSLPEEWNEYNDLLTELEKIH